MIYVNQLFIAATVKLNYENMLYKLVLLSLDFK